MMNHLRSNKFMNSPISFTIGCSNNLNYLKLAVYSVRKYSYFKDAPFIIFAENCDKDDTYNWLKENREKYNLEYYIENNTEENRKGIGGGQNFCAKKVKTEYVLFLHADMFVSNNWDLELLKLFEKYSNERLWINSYRIQPNLWNENSRPGTLMLNDFGDKWDNFTEEYFIEFSSEFSRLNPDIIIPKGEGVSGLIKTENFLNLGGCDDIFRPAFAEDFDLFLRMKLAEYKFFITSNSVVYHFGSRSETSNFPSDSNFVKSERAKFYEVRSQKKFIEKWGFWPVQDEYGFVNFPPNIDKSKLQHLIKI